MLNIMHGRESASRKRKKVKPGVAAGIFSLCRGWICYLAAAWQPVKKVAPTAPKPAWSGKRNAHEKKPDKQNGDVGERRFPSRRARPKGLR
jgi:hypothetical protein